MSDAPRIVYTPGPGATPEAEISALRNVYAFVIKSSQAKRKVSGSNGSDNDEKQERRYA
jgi:hypothetical protein